MIEEKDNQIMELREQVLELRNQLRAMSIDTERVRLSALETVSVI